MTLPPSYSLIIKANTNMKIYMCTRIVALNSEL